MPPVYAGRCTPATPGRSASFTARSGDTGNVSAPIGDQWVVDVDVFLENSSRKGKTVSLRLYTFCALSVTASALAGLFFGGFIATDGQEEAVSVNTVSQTVSETAPQLP
ncbi:hypothetical protein ABZ805_12585 [Saccharopolyspora sp. NPDC047091]|uniref:hypothetical protein n=1 Tax=Saccharopolyspora sp. NPDC047091 TaxID=3155924 RepID=UPI0033EE9B20